MKLCLRPGVKLLRREADILLLVAFGSRVLIRADKLASLLEIILSNLTQPMSIDELSLSVNKKLPSKMDEINHALDLLFSKKLLIQTGDQLIPDAQKFSPAEEYLGRIMGFDWGQLSVVSENLNSQIQIIANYQLSQLIQVGLHKIGINKIKTYDIYGPTLDGLDVGQLSVVVANFVDVQVLRNINQKFFTNKGIWLLVLADEFGFRLGPWFGQKDGPCFECYYKRLLSNYSEESHAADFKKQNFFDNKNNIEPFSPFAEIIAAHAVNAVFQRLSNIDLARLVGQVFSFDLLNLKIKSNEIYPIPFCPVCSDINQIPIRTENQRPGL